MSYTRGPLIAHRQSIDTLNNGTVPGGSSGEAAWPAANRAIYVPIVVGYRVVVRSLWFAGAYTSSGNYDIGLYDAAGAKLLGKGSTAKSGGDDEIVWDCTDTTIGPGIYYMALACSNNTDTYYRLSSAAPTMTAYGVLVEDSALPLPATATMAIDQALAYMPMMGLFLTTVVT